MRASSLPESGTGASRHELGVEPFRDVVMVQIKGPLGDPVGRGKGVQFRHRGIRDEVRKDGSVRWPKRRIDEDHGLSVGRWAPCRSIRQI